MVTVVRLEQELNAELPMLVTLDGMVIDIKDVQLRNAPSPVVSKPAERSTVFRRWSGARRLIHFLKRAGNITLILYKLNWTIVELLVRGQ